MIENLFIKMDAKAKSFLLGLSQTKLSKINDTIEANFNEREKKIVHYLFSFSAILSPLMICIFMIISNSIAKNEISQKLELINQIEMLDSSEKDVKRSIGQLIPSSTLSSPKNLSNFFHSKLRRYDVDKKQIEIKQANILETKGQVNIVEIQGEIKGLGTQELSKVLEMIEASYPQKTNSIELSKNSKSNLLNIYFDYEARGKK